MIKIVKVLVRVNSKHLQKATKDLMTPSAVSDEISGEGKKGWIRLNWSKQSY